MYEKLLVDCGLAQNEALTYMALLRLGKSRSGEIVREASISGGKIYETLYKLIDKGLVKAVNENGVKHFIANDPKTVLEYIKEKQKALENKERELERVLPSFTSIKKEEISEAVSLIKGIRGISSLVYETLEKGKSIRIMGIRSSKEEKYNIFWRNWHQHRVELKKTAQVLFSDQKTEYWEFFQHLKHTEVRVLLHFSPSAIMTIDSNAFLFSYEKELTCIHISSPAMATSLSNFFDDLWKIAKK